MQARVDDSLKKKKRSVTGVEDPHARELDDLYKMYNDAMKCSPEAWDNIRLWFDKNKDEEVLLKKGVSCRNKDHETPLHMILKRNPPLDIIQLLIKYEPDTVKKINGRGWLPLLVACSNGASLEVIDFLLTAFPEAVKLNAFWEIPLTRALSSGASLDVIKFLVDAHPKGVEFENQNYELPLHIACKHKPASLDIIKYLVNAYPEGVQNDGSPKGGLPLHVALANGASLDIIKFLADAYPQGAQITTVQDIDSKLPHHIACKMKEGSLAALNILAECYPGGMDRSNQWREKTFEIYADKNGMLPLHHACKNGYSLHLIRSLIRLFPEGCVMKDKNGLIPLHHVCKNANVNNIGAIKVLLDACAKVANSDGENAFQSFKKVASQRDKRGMYLLHRLAACSKGDTDEDTIRILCDANPEAIASTDIFSMLPIHHAVLNEASSIEMLMQFIKSDTQSLCVVF